MINNSYFNIYIFMLFHRLCSHPLRFHSNPRRRFLYRLSLPHKALFQLNRFLSHHWTRSPSPQNQKQERSLHGVPPLSHWVDGTNHLCPCSSLDAVHHCNLTFCNWRKASASMKDRKPQQPLLVLRGAVQWKKEQTLACRPRQTESQ